MQRAAHRQTRQRRRGVVLTQVGHVGERRRYGRQRERDGGPNTHPKVKATGEGPRRRRRDVRPQGDLAIAAKPPRRPWGRTSGRLATPRRTACAPGRPTARTLIVLVTRPAKTFPPRPRNARGDTNPRSARRTALGRRSAP